MGSVVVDASLVSTRRTVATHALRGRRLTEALELLPLLFPLCARAQQAAAARAVESASEGLIAPGHQRARRLLILSELVESHARTLWIDGAAVLDLPPEATKYAELRRANHALAESLYRSNPFRPGAGLLVPEPAGAQAAMATMRDLLSLERPPARVTRLRDWAASGTGVGAQLVFRLLASGWARRSPSLALDAGPTGDDASAALDQDPTFCARPSRAGVPVEVGPLARWHAHERVRPVVDEWGGGLLARHWARLIEIEEALVEVGALIDDLRPADPSPVVCPPSGCGVGVAATARGPLVHRVRWSDGIVTAWDRVAPTEWTMHPEGVAVAGPIGWPAHDALTCARHHLLALDPCVPFGVRIEFEEAAS